MKLGLDTFSYRHAAGLWEYTPRENPPMGLDHLLQKAAELNLDGLQLADPRHLDSTEYGYVSEVRRKAESLGLYLELGTGGTNPDHLQNMVRTAHVLGAPVVRTHVGGERPSSAAAMDEFLARVRTEIAQVVPVCDRYGVALALENDRDLRTDELLSLLELIDSQWVGVSLDTGGPLALLEDPVESARGVAPVVKTARLTDYQVAARADGFALVGCELGSGIVDLPAILDLLKEASPQANLNIAVSPRKHLCAVLDEHYLRRLPEASAGELGSTLRLVRDRGLPREPLLPVERGATEQEILTAEDELVIRSVRWAGEVLGRSSPELTGLGE